MQTIADYNNHDRRVLHYISSLASFPGPKRRRKGLVSTFARVLNCGGIPLPLHAIDILPYARDAYIDTKCYRFEAMNVKCGLLWSWLTRRRERGYLPVKPSQEVTGAFIVLPSALSARGLH